MLLISVITIITSPKIYAHPGNTASDGCHYCRTNCDYWGVPWGERHCHNTPPATVEPDPIEPDAPDYEPPDPEYPVKSNQENTINSNTKKDGCFIATAAYGTPLASDVVKLREYRDRTLLKNSVGRNFVNSYYMFSPEIAGYISHQPVLRWIIREIFLKPFVKVIY